MRRCKLLFIAVLGVAAVGAVAAECEELKNTDPAQPIVRCIYRNIGNGSDTQCGSTGGGGGGGGGGTSPTAVPTATATPGPVAKEFWQWLGGVYSYGSGCAEGDEIDPVTTVLRRAAAPGDMTAALEASTLTVGNQGSQNFRDNGTCVVGEISQADRSSIPIPCTRGICVPDKWHVRGNVVSLADPAGGYWAPATPHRDTQDGSALNLCSHVVLPYIEIGGFSGSGFDVGRDWLWYKLVQEQGYSYEAQWWGNTRQMQQCNGAWTGSNGWVNIISIQG